MDPRDHIIHVYVCVCVGGGAMSLTQEKTFFFENMTKHFFFSNRGRSAFIFVKGG